jgi:hypothetical protein
VESTDFAYQGARASALASTAPGSTPASSATSRMKSRVAPEPIGTVRVAGWPKVRLSHPAATEAISG